MKLEANLDVVNNLAHKKGYTKSPACFSQLSFCKDAASNKYFLIVNSTKKPTADKYRVYRYRYIYMNYIFGLFTFLNNEPNRVKSFIYIDQTNTIRLNVPYFD
jgi:hypothetical protein